jgi:hypothetical protein
VLAACAGQTVDVDDHGILMPTLRIEVPKHAAGPSGAPAAEPLPGPLPSRGPYGIDSELTYGSGSFQGGAGDYELLSWQILFYAGTDPADGNAVQARVLFGTEFLHFDMRGAGISDEGGSYGVAGGFETDWLLSPVLAAYARGTGSALAVDTLALRGELGLRVQPLDQLEGFLAYRWWAVQRQDLFESLLGTAVDIDLRTDGLVLGLGVVF